MQPSLRIIVYDQMHGCIVLSRVSLLENTQSGKHYIWRSQRDCKNNNEALEEKFLICASFASCKCSTLLSPSLQATDIGTSSSSLEQLQENNEALKNSLEKANSRIADLEQNLEATLATESQLQNLIKKREENNAAVETEGQKIINKLEGEKTRLIQKLSTAENQIKQVSETAEQLQKEIKVLADRLDKASAEKINFRKNLLDFTSKNKTLKKTFKNYKTGTLKQNNHLFGTRKSTAKKEGRHGRNTRQRGHFGKTFVNTSKKNPKDDDIPATEQDDEDAKKVNRYFTQPIVKALGELFSREDKKAIPIFKGKSTDKLISEWLRGAEHVARNNEWDDNQNIRFFSDRLKGEAFEWHENYAEKEGDDLNYQDWKEALITRFQDTYDLATLEKKLSKLTQKPEENCRAFVSRLNNLYDTIAGKEERADQNQTIIEGQLLNKVKKMRDHRKSKILLQGLLPKYKAELYLRMPENTEDFDALCKQLFISEKILHTKEATDDKEMSAVIAGITHHEKQQDDKIQLLEQKLSEALEERALKRRDEKEAKKQQADGSIPEEWQPRVVRVLETPFVPSTDCNGISSSAVVTTSKEWEPRIVRVLEEPSIPLPDLNGNSVSDFKRGRIRQHQTVQPWGTKELKSPEEIEAWKATQSAVAGISSELEQVAVEEGPHLEAEAELDIGGPEYTELVTQPLPVRPDQSNAEVEQRIREERLEGSRRRIRERKNGTASECRDIIRPQPGSQLDVLFVAGNDSCSLRCGCAAGNNCNNQPTIANQQNLIDAIVALTAQMAVKNGAMGGQPDYRRAAKDIPMFSGNPAEDVDDWIADIDRVALVEGWNENIKRRAVISKFGGIAKNWQDLTGNALPHWEDWLERFEATFRPHLTLVEWGVKIEGRRQLPGESGAQYALGKPSSEPEVVFYLICGIQLVEQRSALMSNPPDTIANFIDTIQRLEQLGGPAMDFAGNTTPTSATEKQLLTKILSQLPVHYAIPCRRARDLGTLLDSCHLPHGGSFGCRSATNTVEQWTP
ncbi:hypothetical protein OUZ56_033812 [Daphnia magna]|uniref:Retrotransposon gag domain-containing protein n=1 Tax=Daphnia magna TaxID=35525 RepID=A0ABR0BBF7_9CRUS|nr:hypothetical protein OUZ56_033812 [Daphnia magna]